MDALRAKVEKLTGRLRLAVRLLDSVIIAGGAGTWTDTERDKWACDYKDFCIGAIQIERDHEIATLQTELTRLRAVRDAVKNLVEICDCLGDLGYVHKDSMEPIQWSPDGPLEMTRTALAACADEPEMREHMLSQGICPGVDYMEGGDEG